MDDDRKFTPPTEQELASIRAAATDAEARYQARERELREDYRAGRVGAADPGFRRYVDGLKKKHGPPDATGETPSSDPGRGLSTTRFEVSVPTDVLKRWRVSAALEEITLSEWIQRNCDQVAVTDAELASLKPRARSE